MEEEEDQEPNFDIPQSREEKPAAYPNGPICIYEAGVYLYFEPTAVQATTFDVIINVASEVKNPFTSSTVESQKDIDARRIDGPPAENVDFATLSQRPKQSFGMQDNSPTTPRATAVMQTIQPREIVIEGKTYKTPEYIHMPWEHNTDIVPDLHKLVKMIDERLKQGKRVLIHCQCGVSRSASLVVAYGLYKDPQMSVQEAYDKAKKRSKWIGPNMNLIMQLQEFRNSLLRQNESRSYHNQGFGRRSAGLPTARSTGTNRYSSFEPSSGPRTPQTAPLPPDSDISMQRASTGNMIAISPGPLSAPTGAFLPGFRRSWDSSQAHFDIPTLPTPTLPKSSTTPYVDPKGEVVPVLSVTSNDLPTIQTEDASDDVEPSQDSGLRLPLVPNFSRQLPLRLTQSNDDGGLSVTKERHLAPLQPLGFGALRSPAVASFNIPLLPQEQYTDSEVISPIKTSFDNPWPTGYDLDGPESVNTPRAQEASAPPISPSASDFHMTGLDADGIDESFGLLSPRTTSFDSSKSSSHGDRAEVPEITSPVKTHFPKDIFGGNDDGLDDELKSPRATEFHMTPLKPRTADDDPFGLTSPTRGDFNPFDRPSIAAIKSADSEERRPSFQAILPPAHQTFSGFASLDGTAQTQTFFKQAPTPLSIPIPPQSHVADSRVDSVSTPPGTEVIAPNEPISKAPDTPRAHSQAFLSTPSKAIKTRFSSPNMREQRKLHKLQTEIQSKLPKPSVTQHAADDIDALMSPRAEEFTRNPFHFEVMSPTDDSSPVSSNETIKDGRNGHVAWESIKEEPVPRQWTPEKATVDPRSPVQGSNPIVRNIWDVL
jgi:tyrosine-protein phosphatase